MKPDPAPLYRNGFCQGCKRWDVRLVLVAPDRYRCDECSGPRPTPTTSTEGA